MEQQHKDEKYMRKALDEAQKAFDEGEIPIGAIIVCQDHIIARAHNLTGANTSLIARSMSLSNPASCVLEP